MTLPEWQKFVTPKLNTIVAVANEALAAGVRAADAAAEAAQGRLIANAALFGAALVLVALSCAVAHFRIALPIRRMTAAMQARGRRRRHRDGPGAGAPRRDRRDGGHRAGVSRQLIRTRVLEEETALARASAEEQRRAGMRQMARRLRARRRRHRRQVAASATELQATALTMTDGATRTAGRSGAVATAAGQTAENVGTVAAAAEELGASVHEIGRQVSGSAALARTAVDEAAAPPATCVN